MIRNRQRMERLYLSKGDQDIYIDSCKIPQHHIDGIRFLYRQYKKKKSGVIVNYKAEYARNVQIVLFLKAIHSLLKRPVLVLCKEGVEHNWMEQFQTWTDFYDEVVLETEKPFIKKLVLINTMSNLATFSKYEWSVVIVDDDDDDEIAHQVLKLHFKADFKVYTTSVNMKENLDTFSQIYKWLYPEEAKEKSKLKFDKNNFISDRNNVRDVIDKAILLDAFMQDIVATYDTTDFCSQEFKTIDQETDNSPITVSRKNKDATGTKIKRSRRIIDDDDDIPLSKAKTDISLTKELKESKTNNEFSKPKEDIKECSTIESDTNITKDCNKVIGDTDLANECNKHKRDLSKNCNEVNNLTLTRDSSKFKIKFNFNEELNTTLTCAQSTDENEDFNIENSKSKRSNRKDAVTKHSEDENIINDSNNESQTNLYYEPDSVNYINSDKFYEMDTLVFSDQLCGDQGSNINEPLNKISNLDRNEVNSIEFNEIYNKLNTNNDIRDKNIRESNEQTTLKLSQKEIDPKSDEFEINRDCNYDDIKSNTSSEDSQSIFTDFTMDENEIDLKRNTTINKEINSIINEKSKEKSCQIYVEIANDINIKPTLDKNQTELEQNRSIDSTKTITNKIDEPVVNVLKRNCIDDEIKEMEEKALKKFKGSFLDTLF